jgi:hypothetical protein
MNMITTMKRCLRLSIFPLLVAAAPATVSADIVAPPAKGYTYITHKIKIANISKHPGYSLLVHDAPSNGKIRASLVFNTKRAAARVLVRGGSWRSEARFRRPKIWLLPLKQQQKWSKKTSMEISKQATACAEHGKGCAHISRFSPRYAPPRGAIDCGVTITVRSQVPTRSAPKSKQVVDVFKIVKASKKACKLQLVK